MARDDLAGQPLGQLGPQAWLVAPETQAVIAALTGDGSEVRFVGGCVRDAVCHRPFTDIDLATPLPPDQVIARITAAGLIAIPTGLAHGTVTVRVGTKSFEVTTLRRDVACDGRHATVAFTDNWVEDAARRDLTINALSCRPDGMIFDPFDGLADLGAGRVRFVGDPHHRIREDVLRLLRFFRFYAHYGTSAWIDRDGLMACRLAAAQLEQLAGERIQTEMLKLLTAPDPAHVLLLMQGERVLERVLPGALDFGCLRQVCFLEQRGIVLPGVRVDPWRRLAALLGGQHETLAWIAQRWRLSGAQKTRLRALVVPDQAISPEDPATLRAAQLGCLGAETVQDRLLLGWASQRAIAPRQPSSATTRWLTALEQAQTLTPRPFPLKGRDLLAAGLPTGPQLGQILAETERWWWSHAGAPDYDATLAYACTEARKACTPDERS